MPANYFAPSGGDFKTIVNKQLFDYSTLNDVVLEVPYDEFNNFNIRGMICVNRNTANYVQLQIRTISSAIGIVGKYSIEGDTGLWTNILLPVATIQPALFGGSAGINLESINSFNMWFTNADDLPYGSSQLIINQYLQYQGVAGSNYYAQTTLSFASVDIAEIIIRTPTYVWLPPSQVTLTAWGKK